MCVQVSLLSLRGESGLLMPSGPLQACMRLSCRWALCHQTFLLGQTCQMCFWYTTQPFSSCLTTTYIPVTVRKKLLEPQQELKGSSPLSHPSVQTGTTLRLTSGHCAYRRLR